MKVRHRFQPKQEFEVVGESPTHYFVLHGPTAFISAASRNDYEPLPTEHWQDCTAQCYDVADGCELYLCHQGQCLQTLHHRFIKRQFWPCDRNPLTGEYYGIGGCKPVWAFIIERKNP